MAEEKIICIRCPRGCSITLTHEDGNIISVTGNSCPRGDDYARSEFTAPVRTFTSTVKVTGGEFALCPVKTKGEIPKNMMTTLAKESCLVEVEAPVKIGDVIISNICDTGVDLIATRNVKSV
ncbi:MAG: DUF1667 domain-containing protein [Eubacterium sp.]|nr:DUF1667 domain-containing protein [Eubacterium sp.]